MILKRFYSFYVFSSTFEIYQSGVGLRSNHPRLIFQNLRISTSKEDRLESRVTGVIVMNKPDHKHLSPAEQFVIEGKGTEPAFSGEYNNFFEMGIYAVGFFYPVVPKGQARIRVQLTAAHNNSDINKILYALEKIGKKLKIIK